MTNTPKLDYWMIGVLQESVMTEINVRGAPSLASYVLRRRENRNRSDPFGQLQLILDRLQEIQEYYDEEIKEGLKKR